jgi:guanine nucleotide-binding protein alpha-1 subunit
LAWLPYFDDIDAILFLAPVSCFNEQLAEDRRVNRLADSFTLWKAIVGAELLQNCTIICEPCLRAAWELPLIAHTVFLNKFDLLQKKLASGVMINKYLAEFRGRPNEATEFATCQFLMFYRFGLQNSALH